MEEEVLKRRKLEDGQQLGGAAVLPPPPPPFQGHIGSSGGLVGASIPADLQSTCLPGALLAGALPGVGLPTVGMTGVGLSGNGLACAGFPSSLGLPGISLHGGSLPSNAVPGGALLGATSLATAGLVGGLPGTGMLAGLAATGNGDHPMINGGLAGSMLPSMVLPSAGVTGFAPSLAAPANSSLAQLQAQIQMMSGGGAMDPAQQEMIIKMAMEMRSKMPKKKKGEKGRAELEKMMAMMQSNQQTPQIPGANMPDSEEELVKVQMRMQMQMQKDIQAGKDPMAAIADSCASQTMLGIGGVGDQAAALNSLADKQTSDALTQLEAWSDPTCDLLMYALAQVAEDAAQQTISTSSLCSSQEAAGPTQVQAMAESAQQASQKASWAAQTMETYDPPPNVKSSWVATMRQIGKAAAEAAQYAAEQSMKIANRLAGIDEEADDDGGKGDGKRGGKVPCKFFLLGKCWKGEGCEFAHEKPELKPRPLMLKREEECIYYARGQCTRGVACPFAHGPEELAEISKYVVTLKKEKQQLMRQKRT